MSNPMCEVCGKCHHIRMAHGKNGDFCWTVVSTENDRCGCEEFTPEAARSKETKA